MRMKISLLFLILLVLSSTMVSGQTSMAVPKITDLFSADEFKKAGLSKLNAEEIGALNAAFFRVLTAMNQKPELPSTAGSATGNDAGDLDFYDSGGRAVAYIAEDLTIYLWDGKPVAYVDDDSVYGFNGKHLGWLKNGSIYDHDGKVVAALAERFKTPVTSAPPKSFKQFEPFKSFEEFKPFRPFFSVSWSEVPAKVFFLEGAK